VALLGGGGAGFYMDRKSTENLLITAKHRRNSFGNWCLLSYAVKVINK
jgi:hypothetical protein